MLRLRPNTKCLCCDVVLTRPPTKYRPFYYCGQDCWKMCNLSLNFFTPDMKRNRGQSMSALSMIWWILRNADEFLPSKEVYLRITENFGDKAFLKRHKSLNRVMTYFRPDVWEVIDDRIDGKNIKSYRAKQISFQDALQPRFYEAMKKRNL